MKFVKKTAALLLACMLLCAMRVTAFAHEVPDLNQTGSITLTFEYQGRAIPGGTVTAYRVGDIVEDDGNYDFALTDEFRDSGADLSDLSAAGLAEALADYAQAQRLTGVTVTIGRDGVAVFTDLTPGLYLIVQTRAAAGFEPVSPFLVSVPMFVDGTYVYDVDATPKMEELTEVPPYEPGEEPSDEPEPSGEPETPEEPESGEPTLPQTGQLNWPVPVLAGTGLCLFLLGWALRFGTKKERHET